VANRVFAIHLGQTVTLSLCLSELLLTNVFCIRFLEQSQLPKRQTAAQSIGNPQLLSEKSQYFDVREQTAILWCEVVECGRKLVQDNRSMKSFRNANLVIKHVLDMCVKLLVVSKISSAQGQSVDLSVEIATDERGMIDIISTLGPPAVAQYVALYHTNAIAALDNRSCCKIHRAVSHTQLYGLAKGGLSDSMCALC